MIGVITDAGLFSTIQDSGRFGFKSRGVPCAGPLDFVSARIANATVGNAPEAGLIEMTGTGLSMAFYAYGKLAVSGAYMSPTLNDVPIPNDKPVFFAKGDLLRCGFAMQGYRAYLAIAGGVSGEEMLHSISTFTTARWGGLEGRPLAQGDILAFAHAKNTRETPSFNPVCLEQKSIGILPGTEFETVDQRQLCGLPWKISPASNRIGIRLEGKVERLLHREMVSAPVNVGTIQLPPSGEPLILLNDGAAVGGYPRIASVCIADIPALVQKRPFDEIFFEIIGWDEALTRYRSLFRGNRRGGYSKPPR